MTDKLRERARDFDRLADKVPADVVRSYGLEGPRGPLRLDVPAPSEDATSLAFGLLTRTLPSLAWKLEGRTLTLGPSSLAILPASEWRISEASALCGLALVGATCPDGRYAAARLRAFAQAPVHNETQRQDLLQRASSFLLYEEQLWDLAKEWIPYAFRYFALEWFWDPSAHRHREAASLCLRCGCFLYRRGQKTGRAPRCSYCAKESRAARTWPEHAIAPARRGTWWLWCQAEGCTNAFEGRAQARYCPGHRSSRITPSQRRSARAA